MPREEETINGTHLTTCHRICFKVTDEKIIVREQRLFGNNDYNFVTVRTYKRKLKHATRSKPRA